MGGTVSKNGKDHHQDVEIRDIKGRLARNDSDHAEIMVLLGHLKDMVAERRIAKWLGAFVLSGIAWFMVLTLQHIWSGERWGKEMRHDIDQNKEAIDRIQDRK